MNPKWKSSSGCDIIDGQYKQCGASRDDSCGYYVAFNCSPVSPHVVKVSILDPGRINLGVAPRTSSKSCGLSSGFDSWLMNHRARKPDQAKSI
jgi:hypothetical protein